MEYEPKHAEVARANLDRKGVGDRVDIRVGAALDSLPVLEQEGQDPFDLVFIDADKVNNANYVRWGLRLTRPGSVIIVDNVVRGGKITNGHSEDSAVRASREVLELLDSEPRLDATALQTVGSKGGTVSRTRWSRTDGNPRTSCCGYRGCMGVIGELFPGKKLTDEGSADSNGEPHRPQLDIDLSAGVIRVTGTAEARSEPEPED